MVSYTDRALLAGAGGKWACALVVGMAAVVFAPSRAHAQGIVFDVATERASNGPTGSLTWSHTIAAEGADNPMLVVGVSTTGAIAGVTYGGRAMAQRGTGAATGGACRMYLFSLANPPAGENQIVVSVGGDRAPVSAGAYSFTGVNQSDFGPFVASNGNGGVLAQTITAAQGEYVVDTMCQVPSASGVVSAVATAPHQTRRWTAVDDVSGVRGAGSTTDGAHTGTTVAPGYAMNHGGKWAVGGFALKKVARPTGRAAIIESALQGVASLLGVRP